MWEWTGSRCLRQRQQNEKNCKWWKRLFYIKLPLRLFASVSATWDVGVATSHGGRAGAISVV